MQHRLFLVPPRPGGDLERARRHWERRHGPVFVRTPGLLGYVQNRPVDEEWAAGRGWFCSETWYADREAEVRAYDSAYYRDVVSHDEATFLDRAAAWSAVVLDEDGAVDVTGVHAAKWRVLWFGAEPPTGPDWASMRVTRKPPHGEAAVVSTAMFHSRAEALTITHGAACPAFVCEPTTFELPVSRSANSPREVRR